MAFITNRTEVVDSLTDQRNDEASILKLLAYFDIFHYPLTKNEIRQFLSRSDDEQSLDKILKEVLARQAVFLHLGFYSLHNNPLLSHRRTEGNARAEAMLPKAFTIGKFLYRFPFVRAVGISGSLSKNFADEKADIDFFIITKARRLWLARTIMHLFKKFTFITGHQHYFCMNYYIDEDALLIESRNIFTAIEIATLLPVAGKETIDNFFAINKWSRDFFASRENKMVENSKPGINWFKRAVEWVFDNGIGNRLDNWLLKITTLRWQQKSKEGKRNKNGNTMHLVTGKHFSRSNPGAFQEKVLAKYEQKLIDLKLR
ncbi:MAG: hypothetical protein ABI675_14730 [Chitinophagaceae bacterium]